ncbi:hypothetical protein [Streptomyces sp. NPDC018693]|uniref:hypothetical protein n=1 Tax=unclassified Streptomyces TaxID=2593676 RepID=UPI0037AF0D5F
MHRPLLTPRSALIFLLGTLCGIGAGVLTGLAGQAAAEGVLVGAAVFGAAVPFFNVLID